MPIIQCDIPEGRTAEQRARLAEEITRVVHETIDAPIEYIYVLIRETPAAAHVKAGKPLEPYVSGIGILNAGRLECRTAGSTCSAKRSSSRPGSTRLSTPSLSTSRSGDDYGND